MPLTREEIDRIELIVTKAIDLFREKQDAVMDAKITTHTQTCKIGEELRLIRAKIVGLLVGISIGSAGIGGGVAALITHFFV